MTKDNAMSDAKRYADSLQLKGYTVTVDEDQYYGIVVNAYLGVHSIRRTFRYRNEAVETNAPFVTQEK